MSAPEVTLFGKNECGPCFEAERAVRVVCQRLGLAWSFVDVEKDGPAEYATAVPVLHVAGVEVARGRITEHRVEDAIVDARSLNVSS